MIDYLLPDTLQRLSAFWMERSIISLPNSVNALKRFETENGINLPQDIFHFYKLFDGMPPVYPHDTDENGFSFKNLVDMRVVQGYYGIWDGYQFQKVYTNVLPFCDYMQSSWEYAFVFPLNNITMYEVCIMPTQDKLTPICDRLSTFLSYYMNDDKAIYTYK